MEQRSDKPDDARFKSMVSYFWLEKGDPTRYVDWDETRCCAVWPEFLIAWHQYKAAKNALTAIARTE